MDYPAHAVASPHARLRARSVLGQDDRSVCYSGAEFDSFGRRGAHGSYTGSNGYGSTFVTRWSQWIKLKD